MKTRKWMSGLSVAALALAIAVSLPVSAKAEEIPNGIYVGDYNLGGMTQEEAKQKVEDYIDSLAKQKITLDVGGSLIETDASSLGFHWSNTDAVGEAVGTYQDANLIKRYMNAKDLEKNPVHIELETSMDQTKIAAFVDQECSSLTLEAKDATITRENGKFVVTPSVTGQQVDIEATKQVLDQALSGGLNEPIQVAAVVVLDQPTKTTEALSLIQDVLGTFSTDFSSSGASRATNLRVGSSKINGHLLMPGETLSGYDCMKPFTTQNGYATAAAYENGQVVDSVGGGVCQIATTLYNAALLAEMEITQRQNHSMIVTYVKPSNDAAIAGTYKDIKITNPYESPIYVAGSTSGRTLNFTIYGKESRPANRTIKYVSETLSTTEPGAPVTKVDRTLAPGAKVREQSAHRGLKSRLWKYVYVDGVETEKEILHTDTYNPAPAVYRVGPPGAAPAPTPAPVPTAPATPTPTPTLPAETAPTEAPAGSAGGPGVQGPAAPAPTPAPTEAPAPVAPAPTPAPTPPEAP
ncbi:MAG: VanW family protein, partial [Hungatella sp.]